MVTHTGTNFLKQAFGKECPYYKLTCQREVKKKKEIGREKEFFK
jgi:hypothetical protein